MLKSWECASIFPPPPNHLRSKCLFLLHFVWVSLGYTMLYSREGKVPAPWTLHLSPMEISLTQCKAQVSSYHAKKWRG